MADSPTPLGTTAADPHIGTDTDRTQHADSRPGPTGAPEAVPGYELVRELGRGGMGVVYEARQVTLNRPAAVKMVLGDARADSKEIIRFLAEAEVVAAVRHPHVVGVYGFGEADGRPFLAMEYLPGGTLADRLRAGPLPPRAAADLVRKVADGVAAAHAEGIVHRDLKPGNVLFDAAGEPKVADFGLAKRTGGADLTQTRAVLGTPAYMSPEQAGGHTKFVGPQADVWALGVILYECLAGRRPFAADDTWALLREVMTVEPPPAGPAVPRDLDRICRKCLAKEPHERYPTAKELADDLARFLAGRPVAARPAPLTDRLWKSVKRNRELSVAVVGVILALVVGTAVSWWQAAQATRAKEDAVRELTRANQAEAETQRRLADSHLQQARLQMQRGQWEPALHSLTEAMAAGHPDPLQVRLLRAKALFALNRLAEAEAEMAGVETADGTADLLRADLYLGVDNAAAVRHARAALAKGLPPAELAYAEGLTAATAAGAEAGFRAAVDREPFHHRANHLYPWVLLVQGRAADALRHLDRARGFFPDDPNLIGLELLCLACLGRDADARAAYLRAAPHLDAGAGRVYWTVARLLLTVRDLEGVLALSELELSLALFRAMTAPPPGGSRSAAAPGSPTRFILPPFLEAEFGEFRTAFDGTFTPAALVSAYQRLQLRPDALTRVTEVLGEGTVVLMRGKALLDAGDYPKAREVLLRAANTPALLDTRRVALTLLAVVEWQLAVQARGDERARWMRTAVGRLWEVYRNGGTPRYFTEYAIDAAADCGDLDLARRMAADHETRSPSDPGVRLRRARLERQAGNHAVALEMYAKLKTVRLPPNLAQDVARGIELSRTALREQGDRYPPPESAPPPRSAR